MESPVFPRSFKVVWLLLFLVGASLFFIGRPWKKETAPDRESHVFPVKPAPASPMNFALSDPSTKDPAEIDGEEVVRINPSARVRLRPGETAVLSYWEFEPGLNGLWLVTPETLPDGNVRMSSRLLEITDAAVERASAEDLFPDIFSMEHAGAVDPLRLEVFLETVEGADGVDLVGWPAIITKPGSAVSLHSVVRNPADPADAWLGTAFNLKADLMADGGFDLEMDLDRRSD